MSSAASDARPGVVTFIGVVLYIQGFLATIAAASLLVWRDDIVEFLEREGSPVSDGVLTGTIVGEAVAALLLITVGNGIMRGSRTWRLFVALAQGFSMAVAMYVLVAHHVGGYVYRAVFSLFVGVFVLWALYGNDESDRYFRGSNRPTTVVIDS